MLYVVKECSQCNEVMPLFIMVCYCGGAVKRNKVKKDKKALAASYTHRKWLNSRKAK